MTDLPGQAVERPDPSNRAVDESSPLPPELAAKLPPQVRSEVTAFIMQMQYAPANPLARRVTSEHITLALELGAKESERQFTYAKQTRWFQGGVFVVAVAVFVFLVLFLADRPTLLAPTLTSLLGFAAGFGVGKRVA